MKRIVINAVTMTWFFFLISGCLGDPDRIAEKEETTPCHERLLIYKFTIMGNIFYFSGKPLYFGDTIRVVIMRFARTEDNYNCKSGSDNMIVTVRTKNGDEEKYQLEIQIFPVTTQDNNEFFICPMEYTVTTGNSNPKKYNGVLELSADGDEIYAQYRSRYDGNMLYATVVINKK
jgi:hypothetical protein